ncbi:DcaP family trimeric outer membrane transporter [Arhodomonas sp. SL1]|uniref:DcaP family trimeric outer membrane transporter n=1 Tax=Arhodomonas sp. SL1 TaxID=3425691 RepID=UPI003F883335
MTYKLIKGAAVGTVSALALAAAGQAAAVDFQAGDTTVSIYGYAIGKMSYDFDENLGSATSANANATTDNEPATGYTDLDARQSRLGFQTVTDMGGSDLVTKIEGDMLGSASGALRLRHAYGEWNGILAGQTWNNYTSFVGATPTVDFNGVPGNPGRYLRDAQIRYTTGDFSIALEDPNTKVANIAGGDAQTVVPTKDSLPALSARYEGSAGNVGYSVAGIVRQIELADDSDDELGYGAFVGMSYDMGAMSIQGVINYTDGAASYLYHSGKGFYGTDAYVDGGSIETVEAWGGSIGASFDAGPGTANIVYGYTKQDDTDFTGDNEEQQALFLNYFWSPVDRVTYGVEYGYLEKKTADIAGQESPDGSRVSFAAQYVF